MPAYGQYCPVARALDVVGDRWSLLIVRELLFGGRRFNEIERGLPGISRSLLSQRLQMLERGGVLARRLREDGRSPEYALTPAGQDLHALVGALKDWGARWAFDDPRPEELDPAWLLSSMARRHRKGAVRRRVVIEFRFRGGRRSHVWLLLHPRSGSEVCLKHPGFDVDLVIAADTRAFLKVWLGRLSRAQAERRGLLRMEGAAEIRRAFPEWFEWPSLPPSRGAAVGGSPAAARG
jgi:DNA-binding HxlR family transcriptional regulator